MSKAANEPDDDIVIVQSADKMMASEFIRHVHMRHGHLGFRSRENHTADHEANMKLDHIHDDEEE